MWWPFQWLFIYILGGFTCIPVMIGIVIWYVMTYGSVPIGDDDPLKLAKARIQRRHDAGLGSASAEDKAIAETSGRGFSGYLTVRRQFRPPASNTSFLFAPSTDLSGAEVKEEETEESAALRDAIPPTVSQRLVGAYKQVRKTQAAPPKELFYCVLKGSVLFLYDDDKQTDCVAAISIEKYVVGMEKPEWVNGRETGKSKTFDGKDGEMFGKKNACVMRLVEKEKVGSGKEKDSASVKSGGSVDFEKTAAMREKEHHEEMENAPWFFFSMRNIEMEDLYISLIQVSSTHPTITDVFSFAGMKQLVNTIDTEPDPLSTRWLNAFVGRIFLSINQTRQIETKIIDKIKLKLTKVQRPAWLGEIVINEVHVGKTPPIFFRPMLKDLTPTGGAAMEIGLKYRTDPLDEDSGVRFIASTQAIIPLGYKQVTVNIMVEARLKTLEGNVLLKIKEPPSNRIWWGFTTPPKLEVEIKPVVQDRKLNLSVVLNQLDSLLRRVIAESIVLPAMDDIPFFDTTDLDIRGGIFSSASKYRSDPKAETASTASTEPKAPEEVMTSHEDPSSATAETPGLRKRRPSKSQTLDHGTESEPTLGISRVDTAPASLENGAAAKKPIGLDKWLAPITAIASNPIEKVLPPKAPSADAPTSAIKTSGPATATAPKVVIPPSQPISRDPSPSNHTQTPISIASTSTSSERRDSFDTASIASDSGRTAMEGTSPATSSAALLSAVKQFRAGDKKALQDITKTGMDGVKKGWMNFAAKRKVTPSTGTPSSPESEPRTAKPIPYRPIEDERDAAAGMAYGRMMGHGSSENEARKSVDMPGRSLKERLDAAAHAALLASANASSSSSSASVPMPATSEGRARSGTDSSRNSVNLGQKPSLLSSPSKTAVPTISPTTPSTGDTQWTPVSRPADTPSFNLPSDHDERSGTSRQSIDSIRSASGSSITQQPVSVQPGMGRGMVVPRVPKRPGQVTGLGSDPGTGIVRRVSEGAEEMLRDQTDGIVSEASKGRDANKVKEGQGDIDLPLNRVAALAHSPLSTTDKTGDLTSAIEADTATPPALAGNENTPAQSIPSRVEDHMVSSTTGEDGGSLPKSGVTTPRSGAEEALRRLAHKESTL